MEIKVKHLLQIFNSPSFKVYCERPKTCSGYETLYSSEWATGVPRQIMESVIVSCKVEDGTFCIKINK